MALPPWIGAHPADYVHCREQAVGNKRGTLVPDRNTTLTLQVRDLAPHRSAPDLPV